MHCRSPRNRFRYGILLALLACNGAVGEVSPVRFNAEIRPILSARCFPCHGPDQAKREGDLRLDLREAAVESEAIIPGNPRASELLRRVMTHDPEAVMPPPEAKMAALDEAEIALLERWISEGAIYEPHWSFVAVPAQVEVPEISDGDQPIDAFVAQQLAERGLEMKSEADRATLIRRVSFDLTGLPPSADEVAEFIADSSPNAYERVVDRLLASPAYGERMTADWLDVARYADSYGHQVDHDRDVWPWRDWVVSAFNSNLSYRDFVIWQLAGDLLENPTDEQILATTFNRLHQQEAEGGSVEEEYRVSYVADRVATFGTAFLGLTLDCARCHDHKFDPTSQRDYYRFFSFFQNIDEAGLYPYFTPSVPTPTLELLDDGQKQRLAELKAAVSELEERAIPTGGGGELARYQFDSDAPTVDSSGKSAELKIHGENQLVDGRDGGAVLLSGDDAVDLPLGNFPRWQPFSVSLWIHAPENFDRAVVFSRSMAWTDAGSRGYELLIEDGHLKWSLIHFWPGNAASVMADAPVVPGTWMHVTVTSDGSSRAAGLAIHINGAPAATTVVRDHLTKAITGGGKDTLAIGERTRDRGLKGGMVDDFRVFGRQLAADEIAAVAAGQEVADLPTDPDADALLEARRARDSFRDGLREIMVMREMPTRKPAYLLERGDYTARGSDVGVGVPEFLPPLPADAEPNRLGLARWLTARSHPLTARTEVNRLWQLCFGRGLVSTSEDFGSQGMVPSHPQLLDWLSAEFMDGGWDIKALLRTIVTSRTYRQSSACSEEEMADDPENVLLARGPRFRLGAEMIRDQALAVSGLLVTTRGGAPVKPYEIAESFKPSAPDTGDGLYRRSIYTYWRTTGPAPWMLTFDAVQRDVCSVHRETTYTPLQSLAILNGPQFVEAARVLGQRLVKDSGGDANEIARRAFLSLTSRHPDAREVEILAALYTDELAAFQHAPAAAAAFLATGEAPLAAELDPAEVAAAGVLVNALFDSDGCLIRR